MADQTTTTVRVSRKTHAFLRRAAFKRRISVDEMVRLLIEEWTRRENAENMRRPAGAGRS